MIHAVPLAKRDAYLDYGCGTGYGTELLGIYFKRSIGLDPCLEAIDYAREHHVRSGAQFVTQLHHADPPRSFDFITCIEIIEHLPKDEHAGLVSGLRAMLHPDGTVVLTTPIAVGLKPENPHHVHEYAPEEFQNLLGEYFKVVEIQEISMGTPNMIAICREPKE